MSLGHPGHVVLGNQHRSDGTGAVIDRGRSSPCREHPPVTVRR
jgi:hypothetical protein